MGKLDPKAVVNGGTLSLRFVLGITGISFHVACHVDPLSRKLLDFLANITFHPTNPQTGKMRSQGLPHNWETTKTTRNSARMEIFLLSPLELESQAPLIAGETGPACCTSSLGSPVDTGGIGIPVIEWGNNKWMTSDRIHCWVIYIHLSRVPFITDPLPYFKWQCDIELPTKLGI